MIHKEKYEFFIKGRSRGIRDIIKHKDLIKLIHLGKVG